MLNVFADSTFRMLVNASYRIVSMYPHPDVAIHYIYEDLREEDNITVVIGFPITEFLELYRGQTNEASALGLLASFLERNKMVVIRIHKIPYITHAAI